MVSPLEESGTEPVRPTRNQDEENSDDGEVEGEGKEPPTE